jgi:hypothetical protein
LDTPAGDQCFGYQGFAAAIGNTQIASGNCGNPNPAINGGDDAG